MAGVLAAADRAARAWVLIVAGGEIVRAGRTTGVSSCGEVPAIIVRKSSAIRSFTASGDLPREGSAEADDD